MTDDQSKADSAADQTDDTVKADQPDTQEKARFVEGSIMRHVIVMTSTASLGLMAIFVVDFANLFYIAQLGQAELAAAIGYAGTLMFFNTSICIGITIGIVALVSRALGAGDKAKARRIASTGLVMMVIITIILVALIIPMLDVILSLLGASGVTKDIARDFLYIVMPSMPLLGLGMAMSGLLRAVGDAKRAMYVTLAGGFAAAILDPLLIFGADLGITGAAIATIGSRLTLCLVGLYGAVRIHNLVERPNMPDMRAFLLPIGAIALPAVLTNIATPIGNAFVTAFIAPYGDDAVAGWAVIGRIIPVAFGAIFALSGAVGPIIGQNLGAGVFARVRETVTQSFYLIIGFTLIVWLILALSREPIAALFDMTDDGADIVIFFCAALAGSFIFNGMLFVSNAAFNNLGYATLSTAFNWGKATLGTLPFIWLGGVLYGAKGVLAGQALGAVLFGFVAAIICYRVIARIESKGLAEESATDESLHDAAKQLPPFSSGKSATTV